MIIFKWYASFSHLVIKINVYHVFDKKATDKICSVD